MSKNETTRWYSTVVDLVRGFVSRIDKRRMLFSLATSVAIIVMMVAFTEAGVSVNFGPWFWALVVGIGVFIAAGVIAAKMEGVWQELILLVILFIWGILVNNLYQSMDAVVQAVFETSLFTAAIVMVTLVGAVSVSLRSQDDVSSDSEDQEPEAGEHTDTADDNVRSNGQAPQPQPTSVPTQTL